MDFWEFPDPVSDTLFERSRTKDSCRIHALLSGRSGVANANCHHSGNVGFRCDACGFKVCKKCATVSHSPSCVSDDFGYFRGRLLNCGEKCQKMVQEMIEKALRNENEFRRLLTKIKSEIGEQAEAMKRAIENEKNELLAEMDKVMGKKLLSWYEQISSVFVVAEEMMQLERRTAGTCSIARSEMELLEARMKKVVGLMQKDNIIFVPEKYENPKLGKIKVSPNPNGWERVAFILEEATCKTVNTFCLIVWNSLCGKNVAIDYDLRVSIVDKQCNPVFAEVDKLREDTYVVDFYPKELGFLILNVTVNSVPIIYKEIRVTDEPMMTVKPVLAFGHEGEADGEFSRPWGVHCDSYGRILIADRCNHRIQIFDEDGNFLRSIGTYGALPGELNKPAGLAVAAYNAIIVADKDNHRIQILDSVGSCMRIIDEVGDDSRLSYPWGVAFNPVDRHIAVTEEKNRRVLLFSEHGSALMTFPFGNRKFDLPRGIAYCSDGSYLVTDFNNHRLIRFDSILCKFEFFGRQGDNPKEFLRPQGVATRDDGTFAVADCKNHRIQVFKKNKIHRIIGRLGSELGEMNAPQGVSFDRKGALVVVDYGNSRIQIFQID